jgi:hypothetical protein
MVHAVIGFGSDGNDGMDGFGRGPDDLGEAGDLAVGTDIFGIADAGRLPGLEDGGVDIDTGDAEGAEEIALTGFVDADAWIEAMGIEGLLVPQAGFLQDAGFEDELDELAGALALDDEFQGIVEGYLEAGLSGGDAGMGDGPEFIGSVAQQALKGGGLGGGQTGGIVGERRLHRAEESREGRVASR